MRGHLCVVTFLPHESPMCSSTLPDIYPNYKNVKLNIALRVRFNLRVGDLSSKSNSHSYYQ